MEPEQLIKDVIEEILLRLPIESIFRFQLTCRLFDGIICAPHFSSAHTQHFRSSPFNATDVVVFTEQIPQFCVTIDDDLTGDTSQMELTILEESHDLKFSLQGVCDGLMCFIREPRNLNDGNVALRKLIVFNPLTKACFEANLRVFESMTVLVFYYNEHSKNYKILLRIRVKGVPRLMLHTLGPLMLKVVENPTPYGPSYCHVGRVVMKGNYYCFGTEREDSLNNAALLVFNLETEVVSSLKLPDGYEFLGVFSRLFVIEEKLCIYNIVDDEERLEMWVLVDCREEIWIKKKEVYFGSKIDDGRNYNAIDYYDPSLIFVDSDSNDVAMIDKEFIFYCLVTDLSDLPGRPLEPEDIDKYVFFHFKETLAMIPRNHQD